jgi:hypothetical protein
MSDNDLKICTNSLVTIMVVINHRNIPQGPRCLQRARARRLRSRRLQPLGAARLSPAAAASVRAACTSARGGEREMGPGG